MDKWLKGMGWFFIFFIPLFFLVVIPIHAIHDYLNPWQEEVKDLKNKKTNNMRLLVGFTGYSANYGEDGDYESYKRREWVMFPSVFTEPHTYEYYQYEIRKRGMKVERSKFNQINKNGALKYLFLNIVAYCFCWFVSKPKITKWYKQRTT